MLEANVQNLTVATNDIVAFNNVNLMTGVVATISADRKTISLNRAGIYRIDFSAYGGTTADGLFAVQMLANSNTISRTGRQADTNAGDVATISFATTVSVAPTPAMTNATIQVQYIGGAGTIENADIIVSKIA